MAKREVQEGRVTITQEDIEEVIYEFRTKK
jgi:histone H3/H4